MRDICVRKRYIEKIENHETFYKKYPPWSLISKVSNKEFKNEITNFYYKKLSPIIHGFKRVHDKDVRIELKNTLNIVEKLYRVNNIET